MLNLDKSTVKKIVIHSANGNLEGGFHANAKYTIDIARFNVDNVHASHADIVLCHAPSPVPHVLFEGEAVSTSGPVDERLELRDFCRDIVYYNDPLTDGIKVRINTPHTSFTVDEVGSGCTKVSWAPIYAGAEYRLVLTPEQGEPRSTSNNTMETNVITRNLIHACCYRYYITDIS